MKSQIRFIHYNDEHYQQVCDFLIALVKQDHSYINWHWARWEWMHDHPYTNKDLFSSIGLWMDEDKVIGLATYDMYYGEGFLHTLKGYEYLYPEILNYAYSFLSDEHGFSFTINDNDKVLLDLLKNGYHRIIKDETVMCLSLDKCFDINLPKGYSFTEIDHEKDIVALEWLCYQGFDHGDDKEQFEKENNHIGKNRPHFNRQLSLALTNDKGEHVAYVCLWYIPETDYAYVEPVCTIPSYRRKGLTSLLLKEALNRVRELGAKKAYVISDHPFYSYLGFKVVEHYNFYMRNQKFILETNRLLLREMNDNDFEALKKVISDPINMNYYDKPYDDNGVTRWINWCKDSYQKNGFGLWSVIYKETGEMIGDCGVSMQFIDDDWHPEIGYHLRLDYHQQGIGKEMTQAVKEYFFTHFNYDEVYSYMDKDNVASYKTAEANGMKYLHLYTTKDGEVCRVYRITRKQWQRSKLNIKLVSLSKEYKDQLFEMMDEWATHPSENDDDKTPYAIFKNDYHDFEYYLANLEIKKEDDKHVPDSTFFALDLDRNIFVGAINIRHYLNDHLFLHGGHIGDGIRPSERGNGYGSKMLELALKECKKLGIARVLMTCNKENVASAKVIMNVGGVLENELKCSDGSLLQRYWIDIE